MAKSKKKKGEDNQEVMGDTMAVRKAGRTRSRAIGQQQQQPDVPGQQSAEAVEQTGQQPVEAFGQQLGEVLEADLRGRMKEVGKEKEDEKKAKFGVDFEVQNSEKTMDLSKKIGKTPIKEIESETSQSESETLGDEDSISVDGFGIGSEDESRVERLEPEQTLKNSKGDEQAHKVFDKIPEPKNKTQTPWRDLFKDNRKLGNGWELKTYPNDGKFVVLEEEDIDNVEETWGHALVGYIAGSNPGKGAVIACCKSWKVKHRIYFDPSGWVVVKFENERDRDGVLEKGPYMVYGRPFIIKKMTNLFSFEDERVSKVPTWVRFPHLPMGFWNDRAIGKLASMVGTPIQTDNLTTTRERWSYARVFVEVDVAKELVREVCIKLPNNQTWIQRVIYEYVPKYCDLCKAIGHSKEGCAKRKEDMERANKAKDQPRKTVEGRRGAVATGLGLGANLPKLGKPSSQPGLPSSQTVQPSGQNGLPSGQTGRPSGQTGLPSGQTGLPSGQTGLPSGQATEPSGQPAVPSGRPAEASGQISGNFQDMILGTLLSRAMGLASGKNQVLLGSTSNRASHNEDSVVGDKEQWKMVTKKHKAKGRNPPPTR